MRVKQKTSYYIEGKLVKRAVKNQEVKVAAMIKAKLDLLLATYHQLFSCSFSPLFQILNGPLYYLALTCKERENFLENCVRE